MLGESLSQLEGWFQAVSSSPIWNSTERTPSPFLQHPELFRVLQNSLRCNGSGHFYCLELSCFVRDCASAVLGKVLGIDQQVLGINILVR